ncbi:hemerythrin domain-containing protein [Gordonia soli]|uniref:Hemerythrin-like domain-containing protein n=1 Tax=Gordonia soli NBRC 108243 TaxID=1223545 RepID=M0QLN7_9ACTN|nr:hemerythrin domain-containing protein [Gordonia soli]GAC68312.1 hypothetical protein GS4_14_01450 [Gordonia soli NBRC 108243]
MTTATPTATVPQLNLPGQAAAPAGRADTFMMYLMHHGYRRDLDDFVACVPLTPVADRATWRALAARWTAFADALHHHHTAEDEHLWPALHAHSTDDEAAVLDAMEAEHSEIDPLLARCASGFQQMVDAGDDSVRGDLATTLIAATESLARHLGHEESEAMTLVQKYFDHDGWSALEKKFGADMKPTDLFWMIPWLLKGLSSADRADVMGRVPAPMRLIGRIAEPFFRRTERRAFFYDARPQAA